MINLEDIMRSITKDQLLKRCLKQLKHEARETFYPTTALTSLGVSCCTAVVAMELNQVVMWNNDGSIPTTVRAVVDQLWQEFYTST